MFRRNWDCYFIPATTVVVFSSFANDYLTPDQAQKLLFKNANNFVEMSTVLNESQLKMIKESSGVRQRNDHFKYWRAEKDGKFLGLFIVDDVVGKHEFITYGVALSPEGKVLGIEILSYRETHGEAVRELSWRKTLIGKSLSDPLKLDVDVPNVSGATLSCRNVLDGVKRLLAVQKIIGNS